MVSLYVKGPLPITFAAEGEVGWGALPVASIIPLSFALTLARVGAPELPRGPIPLDFPFPLPLPLVVGSGLGLGSGNEV